MFFAFFIQGNMFERSSFVGPPLRRDFWFVTPRKGDEKEAKVKESKEKDGKKEKDQTWSDFIGFYRFYKLFYVVFIGFI